MGEIVKLPDGVYTGEDGLMYLPDGSKLPDGVYENEEGNVIMYEGNFEAAAKEGFISA